MTAYLVAKITSFVGSPLIREFHYDMFHGAIVGGRPTPVERHSSAESLQPLRLALNGWNLADIICPGVNLVVSDRVFRLLHGAPGVKFLPVQIVRLVEFPYKLGDFSWYNDPVCERPTDLLLSILPDVRSSHPEVGAYFEVLPSRLADISAQFTDLVPVSVPSADDDSETTDLALSEEMLVAHSYIFAPEVDIIAEPFFNLISPYLDRAFFTISPVDVGGK